MLRVRPQLPSPEAQNARSRVSVCRTSSCKVIFSYRAARCRFAASVSDLQQDRNVENAAETLEFYQPKVGDSVVGVVISGDSGKLDVDIAAEKLGMMFTSNAIPFDKCKVQDMAWDFSLQEQAPPAGRPFFPKDHESLQAPNNTNPLVVEPGTILHAIVIGITISHVPILSTRDFARPLIWQRLREIYNTEEIIQVCIDGYNPGGLLCTIEGLTAFLPKERLQNFPRDFAQLNGYIGKKTSVVIISIDEQKKSLIVSERDAWVQHLAPPHTLVQGIVIKVEPFGAVVQLDNTEISGLIHISSISRKRVTDIRLVFAIGDSVKAVVCKPRNPGKVVLSTAFLEREEGQMLTNKKKVFDEAEETFRFWKIERDRYVHSVRISSVLCKAKEQVANYEWLSFQATQ